MVTIAMIFLEGQDFYKWIKFLQDNCKLSNPYHISKNTNNFKMRSLTWKEINKIFQTLYGEQGMDIFSQNYNIDDEYTGTGYEENYSLLTDLVWSQF